MMRGLVCAVVTAGVLAASCGSTSGRAVDAPTPQPATTLGVADDLADNLAEDSAQRSDVAGSTAATTTEPFFPGTDDGRPFLELTLLEKIDEFLELPNTAFAANIAGEMGLSGDQRWVPWILDIMRFGGTQNVNATSMRALETITGIESSGEFNTDYVRYGSWYRTNGIDPGEGLRGIQAGAVCPMSPTSTTKYWRRSPTG